MIIPWYYRALAIAALVAVAMGWAWLKGAGHVQKEFDAYTLEIQTAADIQTAKNKQVAQAGKDISKKNGADYEKSLIALANLYHAERLRNTSRSGKAAPVPNAGTVAIGGPSDVVLGAGIVTPAANECEALKADAAATTLQFLWLRDWLYSEQEAWNF